MFLEDSDSYCLTAESDTDGAPLGISVCHKVTDVYPNGNQTFTIPLIPPFLSAATPGPVSTFNDKKCVDVPNGNTANGQLLQVWSCVEGNTNQQWEFNAEWGWFRLVGTDKCIDLPDGNAYPGARVSGEYGFRCSWYKPIDYDTLSGSTLGLRHLQREPAL